MNSKTLNAQKLEALLGSQQHKILLSDQAYSMKMSRTTS